MYLLPLVYMVVICVKLCMAFLTCHYASKMTPACLHSMPTCTCLSSMPCQHMGCFLTLHLKFKHPFMTCKHTICMSTCQNACTNSQRFFITYLHISMWRLSLLGTIFLWDEQLHKKTLLWKCFYLLHGLKQLPNCICSGGNSLHLPVTPANIVLAAIGLAWW